MILAEKIEREQKHRLRERTVYREVIERYCHVIDRNTVIVKTVNGDDSVVSECMNSDKCKLYGGCRNAKFR